MISVTGDAFAHDLALRTVTDDAVRFHWHQNIRSLTALHGMMAIVAFHARMFGMIEFRKWQPSIHEHWFGDDGRAVGNWFHFVAKGAAGKRSARS